MTVTGPPDDYTDQLKKAAHEVLSMTDSVEEWKRRYEEERTEIERLRTEIEWLEELLWQETGNRVEIEKLRHRLNEVDAQLTAEGRIHARECSALRAEKDAAIDGLRVGFTRFVQDSNDCPITGAFCRPECGCELEMKYWIQWTAR